MNRIIDSNKLTNEEKEDMLLMLNILFKRNIINETEYRNVKARINTYETENL